MTPEQFEKFHQEYLALRSKMDAAVDQLQNRFMERTAAKVSEERARATQNIKEAEKRIANLIDRYGELMRTLAKKLEN